MKKIALYILLVFGNLPFLQGESIPFSQNEPEDRILSFFSDIESRHDEKLWLHLDKPYYGAGDTIWFRAYLTDAATLRSDTLSNYIYVDLFDRKNKLISAKKIKRDSIGFANNLYIPDTLSAGEYTLQAYTGWMLNFSPDVFFQKNILIGGGSTDALKSSITYTPEQAIVRFTDANGFPVTDTEASFVLYDKNNKRLLSDRQQTTSTGALFVSLPPDSLIQGSYVEARISSNGKKYERTFFIKPPTRSFAVQFLPEGGHLVAGSPQIIAFKAEGSDGYPVDVSGSVLNHAGDTVARFSSEHEGMGTFLLTPQPGETYRAISSCDTLSVFTSLPTVQAEACALTATQTGNNLRYRILGTVPAGSMLIAHTRGSCHFVHPVTPNNPEGLIKTDSLPEGILHLLLADSTGHPRTERLVYLSRPKEQWQATTDKSVYGKREKVTVNLALEQEGKPLSGDFSVSVTDANTIKTDSLAENIRSYLLLTSDLKGYIHNPGYYFLDDSPARRHYLDLVMLTHGWRRFNTENLFHPEPFTPKHYVEHGQYISGHVKTLGNKNAKLADVTAMAMNRKNIIGSAVTDSAGYFTMEGLDFQDTTYFLVSSKNKRGRVPYNVSVDTLYPRPVFKPLHPFPGSERLMARQEHMNKYMDNIKDRYSSTDGMKEYDIQEVTVTATDPRRPRLSISGTIYDTTSFGKFKDVSLYNYLLRIPGIYVLTDPNEKRMIRRFYIKDPMSLLRVPAQIRINGVGASADDNADYLKGYNMKDIEYINIVRETDLRIQRSPISTPSSLSKGEVLGSPKEDQLSGSSKTLNGTVSGIVVVDYLFYRPDYPYRIEIILKENAGIERDFTVYKTIGYSENAEFYHPIYDTPEKVNDKTPDLRTTLYWNPYVKFGPDGKSKIEFYSGDSDNSQYEITIEGTTARAPCAGIKKYNRK